MGNIYKRLQKDLQPTNARWPNRRPLVRHAIFL
jgi:hypothetical protein